MAISIWLAARNSVQTWATGILSCLLFGWLFLRHQLYADATLQLFFIVTSVMGWRYWRHSNCPPAAGERKITRASPMTLSLWSLCALLVTGAYGWLLHRYTDAYLPYVDSSVMSLSVVAQCLLMQRKIQTWPFWLAVNTLSVCLYFSRGLPLTGLLYAAFWVNAWFGWHRWKLEQGALRIAGN